MWKDIGLIIIVSLGVVTCNRWIVPSGASIVSPKIPMECIQAAAEKKTIKLNEPFGKNIKAFNDLLIEICQEQGYLE